MSNEVETKTSTETKAETTKKKVEKPDFKPSSCETAEQYQAWADWYLQQAKEAEASARKQRREAEKFAEQSQRLKDADELKKLRQMKDEYERIIKAEKEKAKAKAQLEAQARQQQVQRQGQPQHNGALRYNA